jgi:sec-independent protein translocase protein TatB
MFGVDTSELLIVAVLALIFIGPKELPATMRTVGRWVGKIRGMARHFTSGIETMIREAELEDMEKRWREENERIMRDFPTVIEAEPAATASQPQLPLAEAPEPLPAPPDNFEPGGPEKKGEELP